MGICLQPGEINSKKIWKSRVEGSSSLLADRAWIFSPALVDGGRVGSRADVLHDVGVALTADVQGGVVGLTHGEEVWGRVARHQLEDVGDEGRGAQAKRMDACEEEKKGQEQVITGGVTGQIENKRAAAGRTDEANGSADEGVEVAAGCVDVGLGSGAAVLLGQAAEQDGLPHHDLQEANTAHWSTRRTQKVLDVFRP